MRALVAILVAGGCGNDVGVTPIDAAGIGGPPGSPVVTVTSPRLNESFYPMQSVTVTWMAIDDDTPILCDIRAIGNSTIPIAAGVNTANVATTSMVWIAAAPAGTYQLEVACTDASDLTGVGRSASFFLSPPPQDVSYATQLQPIWTARCTGVACHDAFMPMEGLNLTAAASYAAVSASSRQCPSYKIVEPGAPERSYLVMKLQGSGPCYMPSRMPKGTTALTTDQLQLVRDWIYNGAPNN